MAFKVKNCLQIHVYWRGVGKHVYKTRGGHRSRCSHNPHGNATRSIRCWIMQPTQNEGGTARDALMSDMAMPLGQYVTRVGYWATWKLTLTYLFIYL